ncbi:Bgt-5231 [Blumeria graminis f. sp. tritici]|uniref:Bgt-5231 n=3 Tax=Blumeria graminis TaxID=34373 RepID=A0A381L413_BLUGR|nr:hypothetical protein BGT96224_5231 [Blumeria graminis f. sp. tritici 96224]VCU39135.1 Bgt-5231 [Blumeria graminis f. sp. tritici]
MPSFSTSDTPYTAEAHEEQDEVNYAREVLLLDNGQTDSHYHESLTREAQRLGIMPEPTKLSVPALSYSTSESTKSVPSVRLRSASSSSRESASTGLTSQSSNEVYVEPEPSLPVYRKHLRRSVSSPEFDKFAVVEKVQELHLEPHARLQPQNLSSIAFPTRRSYGKIKNMIQTRLLCRRSSKSHLGPSSTCNRCHELLTPSAVYHTLVCCHHYCKGCIEKMVLESVSEKISAPPGCCHEEIPFAVITSSLCHQSTIKLRQNLLQNPHPPKPRILCPNPVCRKLLPEIRKTDSRQPFRATCGSCKTSLCTICSKTSHEVGKDCPADWAKNLLVHLDEKTGVHRCYKCRMLVEAEPGSRHTTCQCQAQICCGCEAVWQPKIGCPNHCYHENKQTSLLEPAVFATDGDEITDSDDEFRIPGDSPYEHLIHTSIDLSTLRARHINERDRFRAYERKLKWVMSTRHEQERSHILERYEEKHAKIVALHTKAATSLEDRQISAEIELRTSLKQDEANVHVRLRHMEAYCDELGRSSSASNPARVVTERDLRELGQQYNVRDNIKRLHQSKVNVLREKQAKQMEQLLVQQERELVRLEVKRDEEINAIERRFSQEEESFRMVFAKRRTNMLRRWQLEQLIGWKKLDQENPHVRENTVRKVVPRVESNYRLTQAVEYH